MKYSKYDIERANELPILQVAERLGIKTKRQGVTVMAPCIWHDDHTPSMQVGGKRNTCHCYVCNKTCGVIGLVMEHEGLDFIGAMDFISQNFLGQTLHDTCSGRTFYFCPVGKSASRLPPKRGEKLTKTQRCDPPLRGSGGLLFFSMDDVKHWVTMDNALSKCLLHYFPRETVERVTRMYYLGCDEEVFHYEHTMFPSVDIEGRCRNIKVQGYCTYPGSKLFCHSMKGQTKWLGKIWQERGKFPEDGVFDGNCLFGEHLLDPLTPFRGDWIHSDPTGPTDQTDPTNRSNLSDPSNTSNRSNLSNPSNPSNPSIPSLPSLPSLPSQRAVALVESPKNAVVGACWRPELTWVAVGNKGMLKREVLEVLRGRDVIVFPDRDAIEEWRKILNGMKDLANFQMSSFCECKDYPENKKMDIADWILGS